jgi:hypothetical protein
MHPILYWAEAVLLLPLRPRAPQAPLSPALICSPPLRHQGWLHRAPTVAQLPRCPSISEAHHRLLVAIACRPLRKDAPHGRAAQPRLWQKHLLFIGYLEGPGQLCRTIHLIQPVGSIISSICTLFRLNPYLNRTWPHIDMILICTQAIIERISNQMMDINSI